MDLIDTRQMQQSMTFFLILSLTLITACNSNRTDKKSDIAVSAVSENAYYVSTRSGDDREPGHSEETFKINY